MTQPAILGISGTPRRGGNSDKLLDAILSGAADTGASTEAVRLRDVTFGSCVGCERCRKDKACTRLLDGMTLLYPKIEAAHGLVLTSPSHNYNVSALMKAFIDRMYCYYDFTSDRPRGYSSRLAGHGRKAVVAGVCEQPNEADMGFTVQGMSLPLVPHGYEIVGELAVYSVFDAGLVAKNQDTVANARDLGRRLAEALRT